MAKLEIRKIFNPHLPSMVMIPGGPGLGPNSFYAMEEFLTTFNVYY